MFAFALFDERTGELMLARDPLGIKPLYVHAARRGRALRLRAQGDRRAPSGPSCRSNPRALVASTALLLGAGARCALARGVRSCPPGQWARCRPDGRGGARTGTGTPRTRPPARRPQRPPADLAAVIEESVAAHLVADVPVAYVPQRRPGLQHRHRAGGPATDPAIEAYTITFRAEDQRLEAMPDDARYARKMAAHFGIRLHEIEISPDVVDLLPRMVDILDEPIGDPAAINTVLMCEAAREAGVKVLLSGMGADELFGGYRKHLACLLGARYQRLSRGRCARGSSRRPSTGCRSPSRGRGLRYGALGQALPRPSPSCRRRRRSGAATRCTTGTSCPACSTRTWPGRSTTCSTEHADVYDDNDLDDHVNRMCLADARHVPAGPQPRLHRPVEHGGLDRGARAVRGLDGVRGGVRPARRPQDPRTAGKVAAQGGGRRVAAPARSSTGPRPRSARRCGPG